MHKFMRSTLLILFALLFFSNNGFSQKKKKPKFGKISMDQLKKTSHEKFPDAHAVVLFDYGSTTYDSYRGSGLQLVFERHVAIQFLDKEAFDQASFEIPLYRSGSTTDRVAGIKGVTYTLDNNGKYSQTKLSKKDIFSEKINKYWEKEKFTMPNVKEGSIIELRYTINSDRFWDMKPWSFQDFIPTLYSQYEISVPEFFTFNKNFMGFISPEIIPPGRNNRDGFQTRQEGWIMTDVPAFKEENYMRSYVNYISRIDFELYSIQFPGQGMKTYTKTWDQVAENMMKLTSFGSQMKKGKFLKENIESIKAKASSKEEQLVAIYEMIKTNIRWNGRTGKYSNDGIKKAFKEKSGNVGDINLLLIAALKEAGFEAKPVMLSTRSNGMLPLTYPTEEGLNYVLAGVALGEQFILMDATEDEFPLGILPTRCFNGSAVIIDGKTTKSINLKPLEKYKSVSQTAVTIAEDGVISGTIKKSKSGYAALKFRREIAQAGDEEKLIGQMTEKHEGLTIDNHSFENANNIYKKLKEEYDVTIEDKAEMTGDLIYLNPMLYDGYTENPFKLEKRQYPVDFAIPIEETYLFKLTIPDGYVLESLPEKSIVTLPEKACQFTYTTTNNGKEITITSRVKINKTVFIETEYEFLKEFYNLIIQKHAEQIVLKKR